jgi:hypothetical protein
MRRKKVGKKGYSSPWIFLGRRMEEEGLLSFQRPGKISGGKEKPIRDR